MTLKEKTISGVLWTGMAKMVMQGFIVLVMVILARLLNVDDFGIVGMAPLLTVAISLVNDRGFGISIIQKKNLEMSHLSSVFWGGLSFGVLLFVLFYFFSFPLAAFLKESRLQPVIAVLSGGFIIGAFGIVQRSLLTREMAFKKLAIIEIISVAVSGSIAVSMALLGFGLWSLVANILLRYTVDAIAFWIVSDWRPRFYFRFSEFRGFVGFSSGVMAMDVSVYVNGNVDITIIEKVLGTALFGYYSFAMNLVKVPVTRLSGIVSKVVFPAFSAVQDEREKFKTGYLKSMTFVSLFTFPILAALAVLAHEFVVVFLTEKWLPMVLPLVVLTPMAMLKSIGTIRGPVLMARGRPDIPLIWNIFYFLPLVGAIYWGTHYGLVGVAVAFTGLYLVTFPFIQWITNKQAGASTMEFLSSIAPASIATLAMSLAAQLARMVTKVVFNFPDLGVLLTGLAVSCLVYIIVLWIAKKELILELYGLVIKKPPKNSIDRRTDVTETAVQI